MPSLTVAVDGSYARLTGGGYPHSGGGPRGRVMGFSAESRRRLMDLLMMVKGGATEQGLFMTMTYPDVYPTDPVVWKRDLDTFLKRLRRQYPNACGVWRLEWKRRLSGQNVGQLAPHFHIIVLNIRYFDVKWFSRAWYETVASGDERHYWAGTNAQRIRSRNGIAYYASKYLSKLQEDTYGGWTGRVWGVFNRERLSLCIRLVTYQLTWKQFYRLRRVMRRWVEHNCVWLRGRCGRSRMNGLKAYIPAEVMSRLTAWALEDMGQEEGARALWPALASAPVRRRVIHERCYRWR